MSKKNDEKQCFTISLNGVPFANFDNLEAAFGAALGLHKMSNLGHKIVLTDGDLATLVTLRS